MHPLHLIEKLKNTAGSMAYSTFLYDWSLQDDTPDRLAVKLVDPWDGNAQSAQSLLDAAGAGPRTGAQWETQWWSPQTADNIWESHMHGFTWLRDLRSLGGPIAREQGRVMIDNWITEFNHWNPQSWSAELIGRRLSMWLCHYDYFCQGNDTEFDERFLESAAKQARHLSNSLKNVDKNTHFDAIKGLLYAGIAIEEQGIWAEQARIALTKAITLQILPDGGHGSRSPAKMLDTLETLTDMRNAMRIADKKTPTILHDTIEKMGAALRLFRYHDRRIGLFHNTQEGDITHIDRIMAQTQAPNKPTPSLKDTGFERADLGRSIIVIDTGKTSSHNTTEHASALAFEFTYGKDRLFTSCGTHPTCTNWQEALRFTAAHNTACLDKRNACEIKKDGHFGRKVTQVKTERRDTKDNILITASHNGYVPLNGITHQRTLYLSDEGHNLRGEDNFLSNTIISQPIEACIRFHLHPNVSASLINHGKEVLLRIAGGSGWRFKHSGITLTLEDSVYLGQGITPRKTKQIVITHTISADNVPIKWSLKRDGN